MKVLERHRVVNIVGAPSTQAKVFNIKRLHTLLSECLSPIVYILTYNVEDIANCWQF
jgi:KaiC/GvpD/RAD55 family RecA-like ATPase